MSEKGEGQEEQAKRGCEKEKEKKRAREEEEKTRFLNKGPSKLFKVENG